MEGHPTCLLHVPKAAGTSMRIAIQRALPHGALAPWHSEPAVYADFSRFDEMKDPFRSTIALDEDHIAALGSHAAVFGHFTLSTLMRLSATTSIGTVLREPRSRLLSHYAYWRTEPGLAERVAPYHMPEVPDDRFDGLRRDVEERDREIARLHAAVAERDQEIAGLQAGGNGRSRRLRLRWPFGS